MTSLVEVAGSIPMMKSIVTSGTSTIIDTIPSRREHIPYHLIGNQRPSMLGCIRKEMVRIFLKKARWWIVIKMEVTFCQVLARPS